MRTQRRTSLLSVHALRSIRLLNLSEVTPSQITYSSEHMGWKNLHLHVYRHYPYAEIHVPPIVENAVAMNVSGSTQLSGKISRRFHNEVWEAGHIAIYPRGESVDLQSSTANEAMVFLPAPTFLAALSAEISDVDGSALEMVERINTYDPLLYQLGRALFAELQANTPAHDVYLEALTRTFALHLLTQHTARSLLLPVSKGVLPPATLRRLRDYIRAHIAADLSVEQLAKEIQLSPYYLTRLFKRSVGQSLHQYVIEQRLDEAKHLLLAGHLPIGEIALRTGFNDQSHLHRHFVRRYGVTPGQFSRRRTQNSFDDQW